MIEKNTMYSVKNRSTSIVVYRIPELNLRREWQPGEIKRISFGELEQLSFQPGGRELMANFLQVVEEEVTHDLGINRQPEYDMSEQQVAELIKSGSVAAFLDALDFAPEGVLDLIKTLSVSIPLTDMEKREALKNKTGFDVDKAIVNVKAESAKEDNTIDTTAPETPAAPTGRRTNTSYKIVTKKEDK